MISIIRNTLKGENLKWQRIYMKVKIYYPATWEKLPYDEKISNVGFQAKKMLDKETGLFMMIAGHNFDKPYDSDRIKEITAPYYIKETTENIGQFVCSDRIDIGDTKGVWTLHKTQHKDLTGYRVTYSLYYWKYRFMLIYGTISTNPDVALSLYKENDANFYDLAVKTKFKM